MACHLIETTCLREQQLRLALTRGDHEHSRARDGESLMHGEHSTYRALACLPTAAENLPGMVRCQYLYLPVIWFDTDAHRELDRVGGNVSAARHLPRGLNPT